MFNCTVHFTWLVNSTWIKTQTSMKLDCGSQYPIPPKTNREPTDKCLGRIEGVHLVALGRLEARGSAASASRGAHLPLSPSGRLSPSPRVPPSAARPCGSRRRDACGRSPASRVATPGRVRCVWNRFNFYNSGSFPRDNPDVKDVRYNSIATREMFESSPWDLQAVCLDSHLVCNIRAQSILLA